jgi:hypothetical protein
MGVLMTNVLPFQALNDVTAVGAGPVIDLEDWYTTTTIVTSALGACSYVEGYGWGNVAGTFSVMGSLDNSIWYGISGSPSPSAESSGNATEPSTAVLVLSGAGGAPSFRYIQLDLTGISASNGSAVTSFTMSAWLAVR